MRWFFRRVDILQGCPLRWSWREYQSIATWHPPLDGKNIRSPPTHPLDSENNNKCKHWKANVTLINIAGWDFPRIAACVLHTGWMETSVYRNCTLSKCLNFIARKTVTGTLLLQLIFPLKHSLKVFLLFTACSPRHLQIYIDRSIH